MPLIDFEDEDYSPSEADSQAVTPPEKRLLNIPLHLAGQRLDQALAILLPDYSRSRLAALVKQGLIRADNLEISPNTRLKGNEKIEATLLPREEELAFTPEAMPLDILFEDAQVIVLNKPAGLVVHPAVGNWQGTLLNGLLHHAPEVALLPRAGIVHRLDKETSGVMVAAKTEHAQLALVRQLQARTVKRIYHALVQGEVLEDGTVEAAIGRHPQVRTKMALVEGAGGKPAITHYRVLESFSFHSLLECRLETGRTHQIRVHMQALGHPLEGDPVYGGSLRGLDKFQREWLGGFKRQALHAHELSFIHPLTLQPVQFTAPLPEDMESLIDEVSGW